MSARDCASSRSRRAISPVVQWRLRWRPSRLRRRRRPARCRDPQFGPRPPQRLRPGPGDCLGRSAMPHVDDYAATGPTPVSQPESASQPELSGNMAQDPSESDCDQSLDAHSCRPAAGRTSTRLPSTDEISEDSVRSRHPCRQLAEPRIPREHVSPGPITGVEKSAV